MVPVSWAMLGIGTDGPEKDLTKWLDEYADLGVTFRCPLTLAQIGQIERSDVDRRMGTQFVSLN